jgi:hypothetical protein
MTVIIVLLTFAIFLSIDYVRGYVRGRKQPVKRSVLKTATSESFPRMIPAFVAGFEVPENVRYHAQREPRPGASRLG